MRSPPANIKPALLVWARESSNLVLKAAARKLGVKPEQLEAWEAGKKRPSIVQLRKAAAVYRRPLAVFFLPGPPKEFQVPRDFRGPASAAPSFSPPITFELRRALERREVALELAAALDEDVPVFAPSATLEESPVVVAERVRSALGISLDEQYEWADGYQALRAWKGAVEALGVLVFETMGIEAVDARGFSIFQQTLPVIALNGTDTPLGKVFTLAHELAHLLIRSAGVCEYFESGDRKTEVFCNRVAAEMLMPKRAVMREPDAAQTPAVNFTNLRRLSRRFSVSQEAMVWRLGDLGRLPDAEVKSALSTLRGLYLRARKEEKKGAGGPPPYRMAIRNSGRRFVRAVLHAYHREAITLSDVSDYLDLRVKHLQKLQEELANVGT